MDGNMGMLPHPPSVCAQATCYHEELGPFLVVVDRLESGPHDPHLLVGLSLCDPLPLIMSVTCF